MSKMKSNKAESRVIVPQTLSTGRIVLPAGDAKVFCANGAVQVEVGPRNTKLTVARDAVAALLMNAHELIEAMDQLDSGIHAEAQRLDSLAQEENARLWKQKQRERQSGVSAPVAKPKLKIGR